MKIYQVECRLYVSKIKTIKVMVEADCDEDEVKDRVREYWQNSGGGDEGFVEDFDAQAEFDSCVEHEIEDFCPGENEQVVNLYQGINTDQLTDLLYKARKLDEELRAGATNPILEEATERFALLLETYLNKKPAD